VTTEAKAVQRVKNEMRFIQGSPLEHESRETGNYLRRFCLTEEKALGKLKNFVRSI
jgi:hypothetical protein